MNDNRLQAVGEKPRIIAGSGRSGTTWILDVLAESNGLRPIFEPLHPEAVRRARNLASSRFLPRDAEATELKIFLDEVFAGRFDSTWSNYRVRPDRLRPNLHALKNTESLKQYLGRWRKLYRNRQKFGPKRARPGRLVKFIRVNLMLDWLRQVYDARIVLIVRHPGAVVESQLRLSGDWDPYARLDRYRSDSSLAAHYGAELDYALRPGLPLAEALTAIWVIENKSAISRAAKSGYEVIYYENLREHPEREWQRTIGALQLEHAPTRSELLKPSQQTDIQTGARQFDTALDTRWMERIGPEAIAGVQRVLTRSGVDSYRTDDPRPKAADNSMEVSA